MYAKPSVARRVKRSGFESGSWTNMTCPVCSRGDGALMSSGGFERTVRLETPVLATLQTGVTTAAVTPLQGRSVVKCPSAAAASGAPRLPRVYGAGCRHGGLEQSVTWSFVCLLADRVRKKKGVARSRANRRRLDERSVALFCGPNCGFPLLLVRHRRKLIGRKTFHTVSPTRWMCPITVALFLIHAGGAHAREKLQTASARLASMNSPFHAKRIIALALHFNRLHPDERLTHSKHLPCYLESHRCVCGCNS